LVEKPFGRAREAPRRKTLVEAYRAKAVSLAVNHVRRWIPGMVDWINQAHEGDFGQPISGVVHYTRGLRHNGSHAFDLLAAFLGTRPSSVMPVLAPFDDFDPDDPTWTLSLKLSSDAGVVPVAVFGVDGRLQTAFSVELRFEQALLRIYDEAGIRAEVLRPAAASYSDFAPELQSVHRYHDQPPRIFAEVWRNIADHLELGTPVACPAGDAIAGYELLDAIERQLPQ
jgi:predicted dehydrogenase